MASFATRGGLLCQIALLLLIWGMPATTAFQSSRRFQKHHSTPGSYYNYHHPGSNERNILSTGTDTVRYDRSIRLEAGFLDDLQGFFKRFTTKASASHILIKGGAEAANKLEDLKVEIGDSPLKFAEAAATYSACPSGSRGGDLGEFGPGAMVKEFDTVVFNEPIGVVHGPIKTQFGYHLIYIRDRTE